MAKKKTQPKKEVEIKSEKVIIKTPKSIDWSNIADKVIIIAGQHRYMEEGREYHVTKVIAIILVEKIAAKLK